MRAPKFRRAAVTRAIFSRSSRLDRMVTGSRAAHTSRGRGVLAALFACACLAGCGKHAPEDTGIRLGDKTLEQIKKGKTTEDWLRSVLGPPTSESTIASIEKTSVLRYTTVERASGLAGFLSGKSPRSTSTVYFIVTDGVVMNFWADRETQPSLFGGSSESQSGEKAKS